MQQYAQLGDIVFLPYGSFGSYEKETEATYATHELINSKAVLQPTGLELDTITIQTHLNSSFCNIDDILNDFENYRKNFTAVDLIWGNGKKEGTYVITKINERINKQFGDGTKYDVVLSIDLKEYFVKDALVKQQLEARKNAPAVGHKKSTKVKTTKNPGTCPQIVTQTIQNISMYANETNDLVLEGFWFMHGFFSDDFDESYGIKNFKISGYLNNTIAKCNNLIAIYNTAGSCIAGNADLYQAIFNVKEEAKAFIAVIKTDPYAATPYDGSSDAHLVKPYFTSIKNENGIYQTFVSKLKVAALPIIKTAVTRNG